MANSNTIVKGQELMLFQNGESIAFATSHTLTVTGNTTDISTKDHGFFAASSLTSITWEISSENLYTDGAYDKLFDSMVNKREPIDVVFGHYSNEKTVALNGIADSTIEAWTAPSTGVFYQGKAYITSLTANAANGDNATFSITLSGVGKLEQKNYTAPTTE
jgi:hypothetical protein